MPLSGRANAGSGNGERPSMQVLSGQWAGTAFSRQRTAGAGSHNRTSANWIERTFRIAKFYVPKRCSTPCG